MTAIEPVTAIHPGKPNPNRFSRPSENSHSMTTIDTIDTIVRVAHVLFAGAWAGGTLFVVGAILPAARAGHLSGDGLAWIARRFGHLSMASVAILFVTGGHLAGTYYTVESLSSTGRGHLVLTMLGLWLVLAGVLHVGTKRLTDGLDAAGPREAVEATWSWFVVGGVLAAALLVVAGLL